MKKYILSFVILMIFFPALLCACDSKDKLYIYFNAETMTYHVGDEIPLDKFNYKTNADESNLIFSTDKENVAKIDNGKVLFCSTGTTKLIVQVVGSSATATLELTVKSEPYIPDFNKIVDDKDSIEDETISSDQTDETDKQPNEASSQNEDDNTKDETIKDEQNNNDDSLSNENNTTDQVDNNNENLENNGQVETSDQSDEETHSQDNDQNSSSKVDESQTNDDTEQKDIPDQPTDDTTTQDNNQAVQENDQDSLQQEKITDNNNDKNKTTDNNAESEKEEANDDTTIENENIDDNEKGNVENEQKIFSFDDYIVEVTKRDCPHKVVNLTCKELNGGTKFSLSILNGTNFNTYKRTVITEGASNNISTDLTNQVLTIFCKEKCNFYILFEFTDSLGSMTIAFKKR